MWFQYPLVDRVGFEGGRGRVAVGRVRVVFQYPLVDRVGFEGTASVFSTATAIQFQYPLVDRVGFEGL